MWQCERCGNTNQSDQVAHSLSQCRRCASFLGRLSGLKPTIKKKL